MDYILKKYCPRIEFESYEEASGETQDNAVENDAPPDPEDSQ